MSQWVWVCVCLCVRACECVYDAKFNNTQVQRDTANTNTRSNEEYRQTVGKTQINRKHILQFRFAKIENGQCIVSLYIFVSGETNSKTAHFINIQITQN